MIEDATPTTNTMSPLDEMHGVEPPQSELETTVETAPETSRFKRLLAATGRLGQMATRGAQTAVVLLELSPTNEAIRYSAWGAGYALTQDPTIGALTYGATTLGVEGAAAMAAAPLLDTKGSKRITSFLHRKLSKVHKEPDQVEFSKTTKAGTALLGGSVVAMALEKLEDPDQTVGENRRYGLWTSTWLAGACAVQGAAMSEGINVGLDSPNATGAIAGIVGAAAGARWLKKRLARRHEDSQYRAYNSLITERSKNYAQEQGLTPEEFASALNDPTTVSSEMEIGGDLLKIPELISIQHVKWLNKDFYERHFPDESREDKIRFFNNKLDLKASEELKASLKDLAEQDGVVVFDYSESDPGYVKDLRDLLKTAGVGAGELEELGTQTYYVGKVKLKRPHQKRTKPQDLISTFEELVETGNYDKERFNNGASLHRRVSDSVAIDMDKLYTAAFKVLNDHPCKQGLSPDEFFDMVTVDQEVAKIAYNRNGKVESLCILGEDLTKFDWINPDFYKNRYPNEASQHQIAYFPAIATDPTEQGKNNSEAMIQLIAELCEAGDNGILVAFDCSDKNKGFLNKFLETMINETPEASIEFSEVDVQRYGALKLSLG